VPDWARLSHFQPPYLSRVTLSPLAHPLALVAALPWVVPPVITALRLRHSRMLRDESPDAPRDAPLVSVIIPARNEARNIAGCVNALRASTYPAFEITVVDDHSSDETGSIARRIAEDDARVRVLANPDLPDGWFGKQWACENGARASHGEILIFVDADTRAAPDLVTRSVNGMQRTRADLYTVAGRQDMHTFWERMIQPQVFGVMAARYGGTESINRSPRVVDKIANGQYLMIRRSAYDALGGHALVRRYVAEDLMLAQKFFAAGRRTVIVAGMEQLSTRMYTSLRELIDGWRKNIFAGGRDAVPLGRVGRVVYPLVLPVPAVMQLAPVLVLLAGITGALSAGALLWATIASMATLLWWMAIYVGAKQPVWLALCFPIGAALLLYITVSATVRGSAVEWKGRAYRSGESGAS
jgi:hypothetical protein